MINLSLSAAFNCVFNVAKNAKIFTGYLGNIFLLVGSESNPYRAGLVVTRDLCITSIFLGRYITKITEPIVGGVAINVIDLVWPVAVNENPYNAVRLEVLVPNDEIYSFCLAYAPGQFASKPGIANIHPASGSEVMTRSDAPNKRPAIWVVCEAFLKKGLSYNHDIASQAIRSLI